MRPLQVVVPHEGSGHRLGLLQVRRPIQGEALLLIGAVVPFAKTIVLGLLRIADVDLDAEAGAKAHPGRRKIAALWTAHPARIAVPGDALGPTIPGQGTP